MMIAALPSLLVGVVLAFFTRAQTKRDKTSEALRQARREETQLALEMQMATAQLSYATAMALKRGHANGEVEVGVAAYKQAKARYVAFLNRQAAEHLR